MPHDNTQHSFTRVSNFFFLVSQWDAHQKHSIQYQQTNQPVCCVLCVCVLNRGKGYWDQHMVELWSQTRAPPLGGWGCWRCRSASESGSRTLGHTTCRPPEPTCGGSSSSPSASPAEETQSFMLDSSHHSLDSNYWVIFLTWDWMSETLLQENSNSLNGTWTTADKGTRPNFKDMEQTPSFATTTKIW